MASIKLYDLAVSEALDRKALRSIRGAMCWVNGAFPYFIAPDPLPGAVQVFNLYEQITNNVTNIGELVNQTVSVGIANTGAASTNTVVLLPAMSNTKP
jgi:hypothetical protein